MSSNKNKKIIKTAIASALTIGLAGCGGQQKVVACHGVAKSGGKDAYVAMTSGMCSKLAGGVAKPLPAGVQAPKAPANFVECYGVAAAGKNDCGTKTTACAGTVKTAKSPNGWVAAPEGVCKQIGGRVGKTLKK